MGTSQEGQLNGELIHAYKKKKNGPLFAGGDVEEGDAGPTKNVSDGPRKLRKKEWKVLAAWTNVDVCTPLKS